MYYVPLISIRKKCDKFKDVVPSRCRIAQELPDPTLRGKSYLSRLLALTTRTKRAALRNRSHRAIVSMDGSLFPTQDVYILRSVCGTARPQERGLSNDSARGMI